MNGSILWFRLPPGYALYNVDDAVLAASFFPAMAEGGNLSFDSTFRPSQKFSESYSALQNIYAGWLPRMHQVSLPPLEFGPANSQPGVLSLFSGGVDSMYSLLEQESAITHLLYIDGFEHQVGAAENGEAIAKLEQVAALFEKQLVVVETNALSFFRDLYIGRSVYLGALFSAVAHLLGFEKLIAPSSDHYSGLAPWGSHPWTDPLWGSEAIVIEHHGCSYRRLDKVRRIAQHKFAKHHLLVCDRRVAENCGECGKCVRTIAEMYVLGTSSRAFPSINVTRSLATANQKTVAVVSYFEELLEEAVDNGDFVIARAVGLALFRIEISKFMRALGRGLDRVFLGGRIARRRRRRPQQWHSLLGQI